METEGSQRGTDSVRRGLHDKGSLHGRHQVGPEERSNSESEGHDGLGCHSSGAGTPRIYPTFSLCRFTRDQALSHVSRHTKDARGTLTRCRVDCLQYVLNNSVRTLPCRSR